MIEIQKNIAIPENVGRGRPSIYPFDKLEIGDSFLFPVEKAGQKAHAAVQFANKSKAPKIFKTFKTEEGYRCWRVN
jgi:hypothetical protein